jgi:FlaA1/EpsC-like NDP-sugar epimerase
MIFHTATNKHVPLMEENPHEAIRSNVGSTVVLTKLSMKHRVKKFVLVSSNQAVQPTNVMGASLRISEMLLQARSMTPGNRTQFLTTRFGNLLDSRGSVFHKFRTQIESGGPVTVTHPEVKRCFMPTREACQLVLEACFMGLGGEIFEFEQGEPFSIHEIARQMILLEGKVPEKEIPIVFTGLRPGEVLEEQLHTAKEKTLPTYNPKVKVAEVAWLDHRKVLSEIRTMMDNSPYLSKNELIGIMEDFVTEYHSTLKKYSDTTSYKDSLDLKYYPRKAV